MKKGKRKPIAKIAEENKQEQSIAYSGTGFEKDYDED